MFIKEREVALILKIVCLGDSLTQGYGVKSTQAWPWLLSQGEGIEVINKGINGDTTGGMLSRFYEDVTNNRPSHVILFGGVNDLSYGVPLAVIQANVQAMVQQALHHHIRPVIGTPIPIVAENVPEDWEILEDFSVLSKQLEKYRKWVLRFANSSNIRCIDFYECFREEQLEKPLPYFFPDGVHPIAEGHTQMYHRAVKDLKLKSLHGCRPEH